MNRILITGGAGFAGSNIACHLANALNPVQILVLDNLSRRGSELNLPRLQATGVEFVKGDIRRAADLEELPHVDWVIDCSADPSVLSGYGSSPREIVETNFVGTLNTLEYVRKCGARLMFLSTSRIYSLPALNRIRLKQGSTRLELDDHQTEPGVSSAGIAEGFSTQGPRSFYGMTKLASEMLIEEYGYGYNIPFIINRCGLLAGPWQMGKIDQGIIAFWVFNYLFGKEVSFIGFGGEGRQVRDFLHIDDLCRLVADQLISPEKYQGHALNVGGGVEFSCSLRELDQQCRDATGRTITVHSNPATRTADIPYYVSDCRKLFAITDWRPRLDLPRTVKDIATWAMAHRDALKAVVS